MQSRPLRTQIALTAGLALVVVTGLLVALSELRIGWISDRFARETAQATASLLDSIEQAETTVLQRLNFDIATTAAVGEVLSGNRDTTFETLRAQIRASRDALSPRPAVLLLDPNGAVITSVGIGEDEASAIANDLQPKLAEARRFEQPAKLGSGVLGMIAVTEVRRGTRVAGHVVSIGDMGARFEQFFDDAASVGVIWRDGTPSPIRGDAQLLFQLRRECCAAQARVIPRHLGGRRYMTNRAPIGAPGTRAVGELVVMQDITEANGLDRTLTLAVYGIVVSAILLAVGHLLRAVRIALRPLGAVARLLTRLSEGQTELALKPFRSAREIETLAATVEAFREGLVARTELVALSEQLESARRIQQSLLPPDFELSDQLDLFAAMRPAQDVGGDFFDTFALEDGRIAIVVADVSGKGMGAALFAALASTALRSYARLLADPVKILEATNDELCLRNREDLFITVLLALFDPANGEIEMVSGGHCPPFLSKAGAPTVMMESPGDLVVGVMPSMSYERMTLTLRPGDTVFIYSDGFDEAMDAQGKPMGPDMARDAVERATGDPATGSATIVHSVLDAIDAYAGQAPQADDITLLAVRLRPSTVKT